MKLGKWSDRLNFDAYDWICFWVLLADGVFTFFLALLRSHLDTVSRWLVGAESFMCFGSAVLFLWVRSRQPGLRAQRLSHRLRSGSEGDL